MSDRIDISATIKVNDQASAAIEKVRGALGAMQNVAKQAADSFRNLGTMQNLGASLKGVGSALGQVGNRLVAIAKPIAALVGIGGGIGMAEAVAGMESYVSHVRELSRTAPALGTTTKQLSELQYAAKRVGIEGEALTGALTRANQAIGRATAGKGTQLTVLFDKLGISMRDAGGNVRSSADMLREFADAVARQRDPVIQLRMATEMFGRAAGPEMLRLLRQGAGGIEAFVKEAEGLGLIIGPSRPSRRSSSPRHSQKSARSGRASA